MAKFRIVKETDSENKDKKYWIEREINLLFFKIWIKYYAYYSLFDAEQGIFKLNINKKREIIKYYE